MATINSLGIGSGVLTADVLDKLRAADESNLVNPITRKIESNQLKRTSFDLLNTLMDTFQSSVSKLSSDTLFLNRSVSGSTDAVKVTAEAGSDVQSFSLSDIITAQAEVEHSLTLPSKTAALAPSAPGAGQLTLTIGTTPFTIDYTSATTLEELKNAINTTAGAKVTASILLTGTNTYELVVKSDGIGANQAITFTDSFNDGTNDANSLMTALGMSNIQAARDASFKYNGISIIRPTNEITDLLNGVTLSLQQDQATQTNIAITQNKSEVSTEIALFVQNYNALIGNIGDMTAYDKEAGKVGVFNGDNFIKSIDRAISQIVTSVNKSGTSLIDYGISIDKSGTMSLDNTVFDAKFAKDPLSLETFFSGTVVNGEVKGGIFDTLYDQMKNYTGYRKQLDNYQANLDKTLEKLNKDKERMIAQLDTRYEIMSKRFMAYDSMISKLNNQFASLQMQIDSASNN
jgi:flagellar hook-associated protein 2